MNPADQYTPLMIDHAPSVKLRREAQQHRDEAYTSVERSLGHAAVGGAMAAIAAYAAARSAGADDATIRVALHYVTMIVGGAAAGLNIAASAHRALSAHREHQRADSLEALANSS